MVSCGLVSGFLCFGVLWSLSVCFVVFRGVSVARSSLSFGLLLSVSIGVSLFVSVSSSVFPCVTLWFAVFLVLVFSECFGAVRPVSLMLVARVSVSYGMSWYVSMWSCACFGAFCGVLERLGVLLYFLVPFQTVFTVFLFTSVPLIIFVVHYIISHHLLSSHSY